MGRIGRFLFRQGFKSSNIVLVNGTNSTEHLAHFLQYDSVHGPWGKKVVAKGEKLVIEGQEVACLQAKHPDKIDWDSYDVDLVLECSGQFRKRSQWEKFLSSPREEDSISSGDNSYARGFKKVIVSAPAEDPDFTLIYGVNHKDYQKNQHHFISNASCTTNCLAPLIKVLKEHFGLEKALFSTVHSYTNDQRLLDSSHKKDLRRARAAGLNIIPTSTGAGEALSLIFPDLKNSVQGMAFRVPTANVSLLDLVLETKEKTSVKKVHEVLKQASCRDLKGVLALEEKPLVSSDFMGRSESSIVDLSLTRVEGRLVKLVSWYDNEAGFSHRILDFIHSICSR